MACHQCLSRFSVIDGIPQLITSETDNTRLDVATYARLAKVGPQAIFNTHHEFDHALTSRGKSLTGTLLEIGTGTGLLTEALLTHARIDKIITTDVSPAFLQYTRQRLGLLAASTTFLTCDANVLPFRDDLFDVVVGRSVLHHILHYRATLKRIHDILRPGGVVVFYEPVQSGKAIISFFFKLMLAIETNVGSIGLTQAERDILTRASRNMMRTATTSPSEAELAMIEDKYVFSVETLCAEAALLGFSATSYVNSPNIDSTYFAYLSMHMRNYGIRPEIIAKVRWLKSVFADTIGAASSAKLSAPMGYFVFEKS